MRILLLLALFPLSAFAGVCDVVNSSGTATKPGGWQRARILCDLRTALLEKYALQNVKRETLGVDVEHQLDSCIWPEMLDTGARRAYPDFDLPQLELEDHLLRCLAPFQDTHLQMLSQTEAPKVYAGFRLQKMGDRYVVAAVSRTIQPTWPAHVQAALVPGAVLESLDGKAPGDYHYADYVAGSSPAFVNAEATRTLTFRNFAYPARGTVTVKLAGADAFDLPWWSVGINQREDLRFLFKNRGIRSAHSLALDIEGKIRNGTDDLGFTEKTPLAPLDKLTVFFDDNGRPNMRLGFADYNGQGYCYIQLLTFDTKRWRPGSPAGRPFPFEFPFQQQLAICRDQKRPLLFDLRSNNGGDPDAPAKVLATMAKAGAAYPNTLLGGLLTPHLRAVLAKYDLGDGFPASDLNSVPGRMLAALQRANDQRAAYLPFVAAPNITGSLTGGAYELPIVALTSPNCISACDLMAGLLRVSGRAALVGEPTNGTGGRFMELGEGPKALWRDDLFGTVMVHIPNTLHAVLPRPRADGEWFFDFAANKDWVWENHPVPVDRPYVTALEDLANGGKGWWAAAFGTEKAKRAW